MGLFSSAKKHVFNSNNKRRLSTISGHAYYGAKSQLWEKRERNKRYVTTLGGHAYYKAKDLHNRYKSRRK